MGNGNTQTNASDVSASESEMKANSQPGAVIKKKQRKQKDFDWRDKENKPSKNCSWIEFQKATIGSNENKAKAYYEYTGRTKGFSARKEYMGPTPGKGSPTGRMVIGPTYEEDKKKEEKDRLFKFTGPNANAIEKYKSYLDNKEYETKPLPDGFLDYVTYNGKLLSDYDMGHKDDAVIMWNTFFRYFGEEKGKELARKWMKFPETYELQFYVDNRTAGGALGNTEEGRYKKPEDNIENLSKEQLEEIKSIMENLNFPDDFKAECKNIWAEIYKAG